jgi:periplasmic divalent cation tolerance protein
MDIRFVYMTAGSLAEAKTLARLLLEERLVACVNILPQMTSLYRWEGQVREDQEVVLVAKTKASLVDALTRLLVERHSYDCPCVVALPVDGGNSEFLNWIDEETASGETVSDETGT